MQYEIDRDSSILEQIMPESDEKMELVEGISKKEDEKSVSSLVSNFPSLKRLSFPPGITLDTTSPTGKRDDSMKRIFSDKSDITGSMSWITAVKAHNRISLLSG